MAALLRFLALTFAITWACFWGAGALAPYSVEWHILIFVGTFSPGIAAVLLTSLEERAPGRDALLSRLFQWEVGPRWYGFAFLFMPAIKLTVAGLYRALTGAWPRIGEESVLLMIAATFFSTFIGGQAGEEVGWRGYALPRMAELVGLRAASLLLGVIWAAWHLPLFFIPATTTTGQSFPLYLLQVTAISVAFAWLWERTRRSLLPVMLLHAAVNNTKDIVPSGEPGAAHALGLSHALVAWLTVMLLWLCAVYFLATMPRRKATYSADLPNNVAAS